MASDLYCSKVMLRLVDTLMYLAILFCKVALGSTATKELYWTLNFPHKIQRSTVDGQNIEDLITGLSYPLAIAVDQINRKLYWSDSSDLYDKIQKSNLDGSDVQDLIMGPLSWGIAVDPAMGKLYWTDIGAKRIQRASVDGSNVETLVDTNLESPSGIALDTLNEHIYWCDHGTGKVQRCNFNGGPVQDLVTGLSYPQGLALDEVSQKVFWTDSGTFKIQFANFDGSNVKDLISGGIKDPYGIAVDASDGYVYWSMVGTQYDGRKRSSAASTNGKIQRCSLNGLDVEDVISTGRNKPFSIALSLYHGYSQSTARHKENNQCT